MLVIIPAQILVAIIYLGFIGIALLIILVLLFRRLGQEALFRK